MSEETNEATETVAKKEPVKLTITGIKTDLLNGIDRVAIAEKYGLTKAQVKQIFQNPKLKGLKVKNATVAFELIDDEPAAEATASAGTDAIAPGSTSAKKAAPKKAAETAEVTTDELKEDEAPLEAKKGVW